MSSPKEWNSRRPSFLTAYDDSQYPVPTRSGTLASLIRSRSSQSLNTQAYGGYRHHRQYQDEEAGPHDEDIDRLLKDERRLSHLLYGPQARSKGLIGKSNPRYQWEKYWTPESQLQTMPKKLRKYYSRVNELIEQYLYIDCLLDSSIPHELLNEYNDELHASSFPPVDVPATIQEHEPLSPGSGVVEFGARPSASSAGAPANPSTSSVSNGYGTTSTTPSRGPGGADTPSTQVSDRGSANGSANGSAHGSATSSVKRTPTYIFRSSEAMPLLQKADDETEDGVLHTPAAALPDGTGPRPNLPWLEDAEIDSDSPIVTLAIWVNFIANAILLAGKIAVVVTTPSMSVLASLVDAALDFLSTAIVWTTTYLISASQKDQYTYPVGRRRLEPVGVLVFSVIMITSFFQVFLESIQRLAGTNHTILELTMPALATMVGTVVIKGAVFVWCRVVKNSSVRALAEDAKTDIVFNVGSILFPIVGFYGRVWWLDALGGLVLSLFVVIQWTGTSAHHVRNLTGFSAQPDERNLLLYLTMRFATSIRQIQNLRAYHAGDKLFVEVDIVLPANMPLKDSHDLSEVLTYFLESVPIVERAFVHVDYTSYNAPTHMLKGSAS